MKVLPFFKDETVSASLHYSLKDNTHPLLPSSATQAMNGLQSDDRPDILVRRPWMDVLPTLFLSPLQRAFLNHSFVFLLIHEDLVTTA